MAAPARNAAAQQQQLARQNNAQALTTIRGLLEQTKDKLAEVTPKHLTPDRLIRVALAAMGRTPKLLECTPGSLLSCVMQSAQLGLEIGGALGEAYIVPFKTTAQLIVGYRGLIALARRSGHIATVEARVVHELDSFAVRYGSDARIDHTPDVSANPGELVAVYAVAKLRDGSDQFEVMSKAQVEKVRARSRSANDGPWVTDPEEMARKTVTRRLCKYLPLSPELSDALASEDAIDVVDLPPSEAADAPRLSRAESVKRRLKGKTAPAAGAPPPDSGNGNGEAGAGAEFGLDQDDPEQPGEPDASDAEQREPGQEG